MKIVILFFGIILLSMCYSPKDKKSNSLLDNDNCIENICFINKPMLTDSLLDQNEYSGVQLKVYILTLSKNEINSFSTLSGIGFKRLPFDIRDMSSIPVLLEKYLNPHDEGYYIHKDKGIFDGDKLTILNLTKQRLVIYDVGYL